MVPDIFTVFFFLPFLLIVVGTVLVVFSVAAGIDLGYRQGFREGAAAQAKLTRKMLDAYKDV